MRLSIAVLVAVAVFVALVRIRASYAQANRSDSRSASERFELGLPGTVTFALSPDGRNIAFIDRAEYDELPILAIRPVVASGGQIKKLAGTEEIGGVPFWSPDGQAIGFSAGVQMKTVQINGGKIQILGDRGSEFFRRGTWGKNGDILFATTSIRHVSSAGGNISDATALDTSLQEVNHSSPWFLPDGTHFLFKAGSAKPEYRAVYAAALGEKSKMRLLSTDSRAIYADGFVLFTQADKLLAQRFDVDQMALIGSPKQIAEGLFYDPAGGITGFDAAAGTLVYRYGTREDLSPTVTVVRNWTNLMK